MNSIEFLYNLNKTYIYPILKFANIYVDEFGILRPANSNDPSLSYQYEGKELIVVSTQAQLMGIKDKKDEYEIFNPLLVPRHCVFLSNMVLNNVNILEAICSSKSNSDYDDDLDEYVTEDDEKDISLIKMFHAKDKETGQTNRISFLKTDKSGNPIGDEIATYSDYNVIYATIGSVINLIRKYQRVLPLELKDTANAVTMIEVGVVKYLKIKEDEKKSKSSIVELKTDDEDVYEDINEVESIDFYIDPVLRSGTDIERMFMFYDKSDQYDYFNPESKLMKNMLLPKYKILNDDSKSDMEKLSDYMLQDSFSDVNLSW